MCRAILPVNCTSSSNVTLTAAAVNAFGQSKISDDIPVCKFLSLRANNIIIVIDTILHIQLS